MARSKGRTGRPWRRVRKRTLDASHTCVLCGYEIDMRLKFPHPWSATVHHKISLKQGGPARDPANLGPAHLTCNLKAGDGTRPRRVDRTSRQW